MSKESPLPAICLHHVYVIELLMLCSQFSDVAPQWHTMRIIHDHGPAETCTIFSIGLPCAPIPWSCDVGLCWEVHRFLSMCTFLIAFKLLCRFATPKQLHCIPQFRNCGSLIVASVARGPSYPWHFIEASRAGIRCTW